MEISGVEGSIMVGVVAVEGGEWSVDLDVAIIDRTNFTTLGQPLNASGQRTGALTMSGPVSTTSSLSAAGISEGMKVTFKLGITTAIFINVTARVSKIAYSNNKEDGPKWTVNAAQYGAATVTHPAALMAREDTESSAGAEKRQELAA